MEDADCGPACLSMIFAYHGLRVPLHEIRRAVRSRQRDGLSGAGLKRAAEEYGFDITGFRLEADELETRPVPSMIYVDRRHFVVLEDAEAVGVHQRSRRRPDPAEQGRLQEAVQRDRAGAASRRGFHAAW